MTTPQEEGKSGTAPLPGVPPAIPTSAPSAEAPAVISIEEFKKISLRVGKIVSAAEHPRADRLLLLTVDVGESAPRQVVAGIKSAYQPADLVGKSVVVVTNLKPAVLRGVESQGMVLAAQDNAAGLTLVTLERPIQPGSIVK
ncbi:MAG: methionine--tRNA ligase subunit beta [Candidatus Omnitrophica bacterium]|nr:methionine--tRNA ligase subunit beta [Candidatus Omnitrophota bacterium]